MIIALPFFFPTKLGEVVRDALRILDRGAKLNEVRIFDAIRSVQEPQIWWSDHFLLDDDLRRVHTRNGCKFGYMRKRIPLYSEMISRYSHTHIFWFSSGVV